MMYQAVELAKQIDDQKYKIACVVTDKRGNIISEGINNPTKSHPTQAFWATRADLVDKIYLHAEIAALVRCRSQPHTIYVARILINGDLGMCKPCKVCAAAIKQAGVKEVYYTNRMGTVSFYNL